MQVRVYKRQRDESAPVSVADSKVAEIIESLSQGRSLNAIHQRPPCDRSP